MRVFVYFIYTTKERDMVEGSWWGLGFLKGVKVNKQVRFCDGMSE